MRSIDEMIGTNRPYIIEPVDTTTVAEKLMDGVDKEMLPGLIYALMGLYLAGKAILLNRLRGVAITTEEHAAGFSPAIFAAMSYAAFPKERKERAAAVQSMIDAATEFKFVGKVGGMLMLTGKGLEALENVMGKEAMYN